MADINKHTLPYRQKGLFGDCEAKFYGKFREIPHEDRFSEWYIAQKNGHKAPLACDLA
jgi:hypothetical protein